MKKTFTIEASEEVMERIERFFALLHYNSGFGHSGLFAMPLDGDGNEKVKISPVLDVAHEVDACGSIGGGVEIAINGGYTARKTTTMGSNWFVTPDAVYKNKEIYKKISKRS